MRFRERPGLEPLFLVAFDAGRPIGFLPLKLHEHTVRLFEPRPPHLICRAEDEARVAAMFWRYLVEQERGWDAAELEAQDDRSPLALAAAQLSGVHVDRIVPEHPLLECGRPPTALHARGLLEAGDVEFLACDDYRATKSLLDLYIDLEVRSGRASLLKHPCRAERFRAAVGPGRESSPLFHWLLLDGLPIAGLVSIRFGSTLFPLEHTCDDAFRVLEPCDTLLALAAQDAFARGMRLATPQAGMFTVRVLKRWNLRHLAEHLGWLKRWTFAWAPQHEPSGLQPPSRTPDAARQLRARTRALDVLSRIEGAGVCVERLTGAALEGALPAGSGRPRSSVHMALA